MGKKNGGKRLSKNAVAEALQGLFTASPNETLSLKQIFRQLKLVTHPAKMLAIDVLDEMCWEDYLSKESEGHYRLNLKTSILSTDSLNFKNFRNFENLCIFAKNCKLCIIFCCF